MQPELLSALDFMHIKINPLEGYRYGSICDGLPNSKLLRQNALFDALIHDKILFSHQTTKIDQILATKTLSCGWGCLGPAVYTTPIYKRGGKLFRDNLFDKVLSHQDSTKMTELIIEVKNIKSSRYLWGMNYLLAGQALFEIAQLSPIKNTREYNQSVNHAIELRHVIYNRKLLSGTQDTKSYINSLSFLARQYPFIAFIYYEALSQIVMLSATDTETLLMRSQGEFNARCYYDIIKEYKGIFGERFDASFFSPTCDDLYKLLLRMNQNSYLDLDIEHTVEKLIMNIKHIFSLILTNKFADKHLIGQILKTELPSLKRRRLIHCFNVALEKYHNIKKIPILINTATFKPEIGITTGASVNFYQTKINKGLVKIDLNLGRSFK